VSIISVYISGISDGAAVQRVTRSVATGQYVAAPAAFQGVVATTVAEYEVSLSVSRVIVACDIP
jgi:hypothetical protein